jgi:hypothetical protein
MLRRALILLALAVAVCVTGTPATAQGTYNQRTYFTFSGPVALPGLTLPAGKYIFEVADASDRHLVQVLSADGHTMYATVFAISAQRLVPTAKPEIRFLETPAGMAPAIAAWWYPGRVIGHEFLYPPREISVISTTANP